MPNRPTLRWRLSTWRFSTWLLSIWLLPIWLIAGVIALAGPSAARTVAPAPDTPPPPPMITSFERIWEHLERLQTIADENGGNRAAGAPGYRASVDYVVATLDALGWRVSKQPVRFRHFRRLGGSSLTVEAPVAQTLMLGQDFGILNHSAPGDVAAPVATVDLSLGAPEQSDSGCRASDFDGFPRGHIALVQRGLCPFRQKVDNAAEAGAVAVVIFNQGDTPDRRDLFRGSLGSGYDAGLPVAAVAFEQGARWARADGLALRFKADVVREEIETQNVIAEFGAGEAVAMAGAHLDSVPDGAGMNDNASGSAMLLAIAETVSNLAAADALDQKTRLRFAWWGAEEVGLIGSRAYVDGLDDAEREAIAAYLNFDMVGSPNPARYVLDGDGSEVGSRRTRYAPSGARAAKAIEDRLKRHFAGLGLAVEAERLEYFSDHAPFALAGVPVGGVYGGAGEIKTDAQAEIYGGEAGAPMDPCYHRACDRLENIGREGLRRLSHAAEAAILDLARAGGDDDGARLVE